MIHKAPAAVSCSPDAYRLGGDIFPFIYKIYSSRLKSLLDKHWESTDTKIGKRDSIYKDKVWKMASVDKVWDMASADKVWGIASID